MQYSHLRILLKEAQLSPEQLGERIGMSGMTLRRWAAGRRTGKVPRLYERAIHQVVYELMAEGRLPEDSVLSRLVMEKSGDCIARASMRSIGFTDEFIRTADHRPESLVAGLSLVGSDEVRQNTIRENKRKISGYQKLGQEWKRRIQVLTSVLTSQTFTKTQKFPAYGALFYLLCPFDLIPDQIPVFGLMDDFFILGIVVVYYLEHFPQFFKRSACR